MAAVRSRDQQWALVDDTGRTVRAVAELGPYLGQPEAFYRVTGGDGYSDHASLEDAQAAAIASLH